MTIRPMTFDRKPFSVQAVQLTPENLEAVAKWCGGQILTEKQGGRDVKFIKVPVSRPLNIKQTQAYINEWRREKADWVLKAGTGFKVYTDEALWRQFNSRPENLTLQQEQLFDCS